MAEPLKPGEGYILQVGDACRVIARASADDGDVPLTSDIYEGHGREGKARAFAKEHGIKITHVEDSS